MITRHDVSVEPDRRVLCSCGWSVDAKAWGPQPARQLAYLHVGAPERETAELLSLAGVAR